MPLGTARALDKQRHGSLRDHLDRHDCAEHSPLAPENLAEALVERLREFSRGGLNEARSVAAPGIAVERELADAQRFPRPERLVHTAVGIVENPQRADLARQPVSVLGGVSNA